MITGFGDFQNEAPQSKVDFEGFFLCFEDFFLLRAGLINADFRLFTEVIKMRECVPSKSLC